MKTLLCLSLLFVIAAGARAAEMMVCPPWEITVVDESGKPLAGCVVVQEWGSDFKEVYVTGSTNAVTDAAGRVAFPARNITPPTGEKTWKKIERTIDRKAAGTPASSAFISKPGYHFEWLNSRSESRNVATREGLRARVVLKAEKRG
jgi:hypothetical protein